mmetsp:Transcript_2433/g.7222  ORF Transcript_2433/g.7222 Transcript_2433/m.7222 type:complete len:223 (+) Transcript_2433:1519-2187(+)
MPGHIPSSPMLAMKVCCAPLGLLGPQGSSSRGLKSEMGSREPHGDSMMYVPPSPSSTSEGRQPASSAAQDSFTSRRMCASRPAPIGSSLGLARCAERTNLDRQLAAVDGGVRACRPGEVIVVAGDTGAEMVRWRGRAGMSSSTLMERPLRCTSMPACISPIARSGGSSSPRLSASRERRHAESGRMGGGRGLALRPMIPFEPHGCIRPTGAAPRAPPAQPLN